MCMPLAIAPKVSTVVTGKPAWIALGSTSAKMGRVAAINATGGIDTFKGVLGTLIVKANVLTTNYQGKRSVSFPQKVAEKHDRGEDFILLDVRTEMEYKSRHIKDLTHSTG